MEADLATTWMSNIRLSCKNGVIGFEIGDVGTAAVCVQLCFSATSAHEISVHMTDDFANDLMALDGAVKDNAIALLKANGDDFETLIEMADQEYRRAA